MRPSSTDALPRWEERLLRASLPTGAMCDAIVGDLQEEYVRDTVHLGMQQARNRYRQRTAGIVAYALLDLLRLRPWSSEATPGSTRAAIATRGGTGQLRGLVGRADVALMLAAFGVLGLGIVVNTALFAAARYAPPVAGETSILALASVVLALGTAVVAAIMLCVGPRWLRRRACRDAVARNAAALTAAAGSDALR